MLSFDGLKNKLVRQTALRLAAGKKLQPKHTEHARKIVASALERMWQRQIDLDRAFDPV